VTGEQDDRDSQGREDEEVDHTVERDQAQDVTVPERSAPQRQCDLVAPRWETVRWRSRRCQWQPRVAPEAAVPPQAVRLADQDVVLQPHFGCVCAD
jgi:hypothetical protein